MKKKLFAILLVTTMVLSLTACGNSKPKNASDETTKKTETIETDEHLLTMEITIPADYMENTTQEDLDKAVKENGFNSATLNDDGSATYVMTKAKHKEYMEELAKTLRSSFTEMIGSEEYPNFTNIEANTNFTSFKITTKSTELDFSESFSVLAFYMYGGLYNSFNGTSIDNIHIDFVNADSGEVIHSADSKDLAEETE